MVLSSSDSLSDTTEMGATGAKSSFARLLAKVVRAEVKLNGSAGASSDELCSGLWMTGAAGEAEEVVFGVSLLGIDVEEGVCCGGSVSSRAE